MFRNRQPKYSANLVFHNGTTRMMIMTKQQVPAGEIMFEFPDMMLCPANSFFINRPVPLLTTDEYLIAGQTYLVLPHNSFSSGQYLSMSSIAALASTPNKVINFNEKSFQYVKGSNGSALIKVSPEFLTGVLLSSGKVDDEEFLRLCSTPELKKHYEQLVGTEKQRNHVWSPKLETISEYNNNNHVGFCSYRFLELLEWTKQRQLLKNMRKFKVILHLLSRIDLRSKDLHRNDRIYRIKS